MLVIQSPPADGFIVGSEKEKERSVEEKINKEEKQKKRKQKVKNRKLIISLNKVPCTIPSVEPTARSSNEAAESDIPPTLNCYRYSV